MSVSSAIYLDSNAGAKLKPVVRQALAPFFQDPSSFLANPSSVHYYGRKSKRQIAEARENIARSLGRNVDPEQLIFTSSGTEANQLAIRSILEPLLLAGKKPHWITTPVEHDSVLQMVEWLKAQGGRVSFLPVDASGLPDVSKLGKLWREDTALVSAVWVNNETGVISDIEALAKEVSTRNGCLHLDGAQAWGKISFDLNNIGASFVSFSAHKIGGLSGTGVLWIDRGVEIHSAILGKQEKARRGGTENVLGIMAAGAAASSLSQESLMRDQFRIGCLREELEGAICRRISGAVINGQRAPRVSGTTSVSFEDVEGEGLVMAMDLAGFCVSAGSACSSGVVEPSHVLMAMGRTRGQALGSLRISLSEDLKKEDLMRFVDALEKSVVRIRLSRNGESRG